MKILIAFVGLIFISNPALSEEPAAEKVHMEIHNPPAEAIHCQDCHMKKNQEFLLSKNRTALKHADLAGKHGRTEIACGSCHDRNNYNFLRTSADAPASFSNPSPVCKQCHEDRYRDWQKGMHGKRLGGWNREKEQLHCISCHSPHSVRFKQLKADPPPVMPKLGRDKEKENAE
jgi:hypothetical protein